MQNITIDTTPEKLLAYRATKNRELFMNYEDDQLFFYCNTGEGFIFKAHIPSPKKYKHLFKYCNAPVTVESLAILTHDFTGTKTWPGVEIPEPSSIYTCAPNAGYKLIITSIVTRFPVNADLSNNPITFTVWKYVPAYNAVLPVISQSYYDATQLMLQSNDPWYTVEFVQDQTFSGKMVEVKFRYADSDSNDHSKLQLSSALGEKITVSLVEDKPLLDLQGNPLIDPCYAIFNTKRVVEF